jgi:hypothetical protein
MFQTKSAIYLLVKHDSGLIASRATNDPLSALALNTGSDACFNPLSAADVYIRQIL